jgi:hypothetical protein
MGGYAAKYDTPEKRRAYNRERKADYREIRGQGLRGKPFIGVDGEGGNDAEGHHQYYLLTAGEWRLVTGKPLTAQDCLGFLAKLPPDAYYVGYFFDYDVTMILRGLPPNKIDRLFDREGRTKVVAPGREYTYPVDWHGFQIDYLPHKEFKVRRFTGLDPLDKPTYSHWVVINDVGTFFQCSFVKALTQWEVATPEEMETIATGKDMRADFGNLTNDIIEYNALEIVLLQKLMTAFREVCEEIGYVPARWQGPGNLASAMLKHHGVTKSKLLDIPLDVLEAAGAAYYGGRFETTISGTQHGPIFAYDINSAYPDALTHLPCLVHGVWEALPGDRWEEVRGQALYLAHGAYRLDPEGARYPALFNFPHRTKQGSIYYPAKGSGWYWSVEIEQSAHQIFTPDTIYVYRNNCECAPFDWVPPIYDMRIALGKTKKGGILKLGLNSIYGKMAQSIGAAPYANPIWAGLITALTRAKLSSISHYPGIISPNDHTAPPECLCRQVMMYATDAVFSTVRLHVFKTGKRKGIMDERRIVPSKKLGDWDLTTHEMLHIIQPGLYFTSYGRHMPPKTRGVPRQKVVDRMEDFLAVSTELAYGRIKIAEAYIEVALKQFIGLRIANHRGRLDLAGEWLEVTKKVSYDWGNKRNKLGVPLLGSRVKPTITTGPYHQDAGESTPYSKDIGRMLDDYKLEKGFDGAPDWAPNLMDSDM